MSEDYQSIISTLETTRDTLAADLAATATDLAALIAIPNFSESGEGGSESIDNPGLRRQLMDEIKQKGEQIREISRTMAALQGGFQQKRIRPCRRWRWLW